MAETDRASPIESPCNKVCVIDAACGLCIGCGRTLAEIGGWLSMTSDERRRVMDELPARRAAPPCTSAPFPKFVIHPQHALTRTSETKGH
jgi:predicted Fe-S protein YdhL (DUF1289 family)